MDGLIIDFQYAIAVISSEVIHVNSSVVCGKIICWRKNSAKERPYVSCDIETTSQYEYYLPKP